MCRFAPILVALLGIALLVVACDGDEGGISVRPTRSPAASETPSGRTQTPGGGTPTGDGDATATAEPTEDGGGETAPPSIVGTPAIAPADLTQYEGLVVEQEDCSYDPRTALATCPARGIYAPDPPIVGEDISCRVAIVEDRPVALLCRSVQPQQAVNYAIR